MKGKRYTEHEKSQIHKYVDKNEDGPEGRRYWDSLALTMGRTSDALARKWDRMKYDDVNPSIPYERVLGIRSKKRATGMISSLAKKRPTSSSNKIRLKVSRRFSPIELPQIKRPQPPSFMPTPTDNEFALYRELKAVFSYAYLRHVATKSKMEAAKTLMNIATEQFRKLINESDGRLTAESFK